jgi:hypothetical protein
MAPPVARKQFSRKPNQIPCHACYRPKEIDTDYCLECITSGKAAWHVEMLARWVREQEEAE